MRTFFRTLSLRLPVVSIVVLALLALSTVMVSGADQAVKLTAPENTFAHLYRPFPATLGQEFSVQASFKVNQYGGSSWTPCIFVYWSPLNYLGIGQQPNKEYRVNTQGLRTIGRKMMDFPSGDWVEAKLNFTATSLQMYGRPKGGEWVLIVDTARPEGFVGMPTEIILGKGFFNNTPTYPNEHLDNPHTALGNVGITYMDNLIVTVDGKEVLVDNFNSLNGWKQHQDASIAPAFELVAEQVANEPFPAPEPAPAK